MTRRPDHIAQRTPFPKAVRVAVLHRSGGFCEHPDCDKVGTDFDHIKAVALGGESTLENCQLLCREHNAAKGVTEGRIAAKADRQAGRSGQRARRERAKAKGTYRGIQSQGFNTKYKKRFDGTVVERT